MGIRPGGMVSQHAKSTVTQTQNVTQSNNNEQLSAVAYASDGGTATAYQFSEQSNSNSQVGTATAANRIEPSCSENNIDQIAEAEVEQNQIVEQLNVSQQSEANAEASGEEPEATATQLNYQTNNNLQIGTAEAENICGDTVGITNCKDVPKQDAVFNQMKTEKGHVFNDEAVISLNGIKVTVSVDEDKRKLNIQVEKNGMIALNEFKQVSSKVKGLKTESTPTANKIVIATEEDKICLEIELTKTGEIFVNGEKISAV